MPSLRRRIFSAIELGSLHISASSCAYSSSSSLGARFRHHTCSPLFSSFPISLSLCFLLHLFVIFISPSPWLLYQFFAHLPSPFIVDLVWGQSCLPSSPLVLKLLFFSWRVKISSLYAIPTVSIPNTRMWDGLSVYLHLVVY